MAKKVAKKKKTTSSKTKKAAAPAGPIVPAVCSLCGSLYMPSKDTTLCGLCLLAKAKSQSFGTPTRPKAEGADKLAAIGEESAAKKKTGTKKKASSKKKTGTKKKSTKKKK